MARSLNRRTCQRAPPPSLPLFIYIYYSLLSLLLFLHHPIPVSTFSSASPSSPSASPASRLPPTFDPLASFHRDPVVLHDWSDRLTPYQDAWDIQHRLVEAKLASLSSTVTSSSSSMNSVQASPDRLLLLQHPPTYTLGTGSTPTNLLFDPSDPSTAPAALFKTERGGEATWHGPGQLVAYPLLDLKHYRQDLHWYLRALEEVVIQTLAPLGIEGGREEGLTGVWVEGHKVAAVGVKVKRWVTMHGVALNVDPSMDYFKHIVPCGIGDRPVGSVMNFWKGESGKEVITVEEVALLMKRAFEDVFGVVLVDAEHSGEEN